MIGGRDGAGRVAERMDYLLDAGVVGSHRKPGGNHGTAWVITITIAWAGVSGVYHLRLWTCLTTCIGMVCLASAAGYCRSPGPMISTWTASLAAVESLGKARDSTEKFTWSRTP